MRQINKIILHCSATRVSQDVGLDDINRWHKERGFKDHNGDGMHCGYHFLVLRNGDVVEGRPAWREGAHARGHNKYSIGICMIGGLDRSGNPESNYTYQQWAALYDLVERETRKHPDAEVCGHNDFSNKACPCFNASEWWG